MNILQAVSSVASSATAVAASVAKDALGVAPPEDTGEAFARR